MTFALILIGVIVLLALVAVVVQAPEIRRYLKIRSM
jgi:hypothetical protein